MKATSQSTKIILCPKHNTVTEYIIASWKILVDIIRIRFKPEIIGKYEWSHVYPSNSNSSQLITHYTQPTQSLLQVAPYLF